MLAQKSQEIRIVLALEENALEVVAAIVDVVVLACSELDFAIGHLYSHRAETRFLQETWFLTQIALAARPEFLHAASQRSVFRRGEVGIGIDDLAGFSAGPGDQARGGQRREAH